MQEVREAETTIIAGRLYLIPAKGILAEMESIIREKFEGKNFKYIDGSFKLPSSKARFEIEAVVDDDCEICPVAVEAVAEIAAKHPNVTAKIYNITYVKPPFGPVDATPTFRINGKIRFTGIPMNPSDISRYFSDFLKEAYIATHPKLKWLTERLQNFARAYGYRRNPNDNHYMNLIYKLLRNIDEYGYPYCPCRPLKKKPSMSLEEIYELNKDKICPCIYVHKDIKTRGHCLCGLFWSKEKVDEYIRMRLERYGWIIKEIERTQKALEELKKRIITGRAKTLAETILNKLEEIYVSLPE